MQYQSFIIFTVIVAAIFLLYPYIRRHRRSRWLLKKGMFEPLQNWQLDNYCQKARELKFEQEFLTWMRFIRGLYGHDNIKIGHAVWAIQQCCFKELPTDDSKVPKFDDPKKTRVTFKPTD